MNLATTLALYCYGTSTGVLKEWAVRDRGVHKQIADELSKRGYKWSAEATDYNEYEHKNGKQKVIVGTNGDWEHYRNMEKTGEGRGHKELVAHLSSMN